MTKTNFKNLSTLIRLLAVLIIFAPLGELQAYKSAAGPGGSLKAVSQTYADGLSNQQRQELSRRLLDLARSRGVKVGTEVFLVGVRGWLHAENRRAEYDDLFAVFWPGGGVRFFRGNTDPSVYRQGVATLALGLWRYKPGIHTPPGPGRKGYAAFRQQEAVQVHRDGQARLCPLGSSINLHSGGLSRRARTDGLGDRTSSLGCQTLPAEDWEAFRTLLTGILAQHHQADFAYLLIAKDML